MKTETVKLILAWSAALALWAFIISRLAAAPNPPPLSNEDRARAAHSWLYQRFYYFVSHEGI